MSVEGKISSDENDALTALYPALGDAARIYLERYAPEGLTAEDLVQEAVLRWISSRAEFRGRRQMYLWLATTMKNFAAETHRSKDVLDIDHEPLE